MFKSVFTRLLVTFLFIIFIILGILVTMQSTMFSREYMNSRIAEVKEEAVFLAQQLQNNRTLHTDQTYLTSIELLTKKYDALVWVLDSGGKVVMTQKQYEEFLNRVLPEDQISSFVQPILGGEVVVSTGLYQGGDPKKTVISVGAPVYENSVVIGAVVIHVPETMLSSLASKVNERIFQATLICGIVALFFVVIASRMFTQPLRQLNELARQAELGNFSYRANIKGESEFTQMGNRLNKMMSRLGKTERLRSDFIQNASHELKAPITVISGYSQALLEELPDEKKQEYVSIILDETNRMDGLISNLMHLSRMESGSETLNRERFNLNDLISQKVLSFELEIEKKNLQLELNYAQEKLEVVADKAKIDRVLTNLIQNALKYTMEGDGLIITTRQVRAKAYIEIKDTGIGVDKNDIENIFDRFYTVDKAKTPGKSGSGIGLSLVKRILQLHGSDIFVESVKGEYTKFYFYLDM